MTRRPHARAWARYALAPLLVAASLGSLAAGCKDETTRIITQGGPAAIGTETDPFNTNWASSAHADGKAEAFNHWNTDGQISASCARCHSEGGFLDFVGADGSAAGVVDKAAAIGTVVSCDVCHSDRSWALTTVTFPSGNKIANLGREGICMTCHQGRESGKSLGELIAKSVVGDDDTPDPENLYFLNIHYLPAGATLYGKEAAGGFQFKPEHNYQGKFDHAPGFATCVGCHDKHTLEVKVNACSECHGVVQTTADLVKIRGVSSAVDFDGDANVTEGIAQEIETLQAKLLRAMQDYAIAKSIAKIAYDAATYPYFFVDKNGDFVAAGENVYANRYTTWTKRLLKVAYNYQYSKKDPGGFAHNGKYIVQLLFDSIEELESAGVTVPNFANIVRNNGKHFDIESEAYRHWDHESAEMVSSSCARCHTPTGFSSYVTSGVDTTLLHPLPEGLACDTCHTGENYFAGDAPRKLVGKVTFPSGVSLTTSVANDAFICMTCHQGRESKATVEAAIATSGLAVDEPATSTKKLGFKNVHYLPAGAMMYGKTADVGVPMSATATYAGQDKHEAIADVTAASRCTYCHEVTAARHSFSVHDNAAKCRQCHDGPAEMNGTTDITKIYRDTKSYVANGPLTLKKQVEAFEGRLYDAIKAYATATSAGIVYDSASHPYWFEDATGDGVPDIDGAGKKISYTKFTPRLARASFNYQFSHKEPGAWAHNHKYMLQILFDSIQNLGGNVTGLTRP